MLKPLERVWIQIAVAPGHRALRASLALPVLIAGVLLAAEPAAATIYGGTNCDQQPSAPYCTVSAGQTGSEGRPAASHSGCHNSDGVEVPCSIPGKGWYLDGCYYRPSTDSEIPGPAASGKRWFTGICGDPVNGFFTELGFVRQFQTAPGPETVAQLAIAMLRLPSPSLGMSPSIRAPQVVRVPSWLWVAPGSWAARSATASAAGVSVTATARPVSVSWSTGDGGAVICSGPGTVWSARFSPAAASPTCGHTYVSPSPAVGFTVRATVTWTVTWAGAGMTGTAGPLTSPAQAVVHVVQSSAVNTGGMAGAEQ